MIADLQPVDGLIPLHIAIENGHTDVVNALLDDPRTGIAATGDVGLTALNLAARSRNNVVFNRLLQLTPPDTIAEAFLSSVASGDAITMRLFLDHNPGLAQYEKPGYDVPIHIAATNGSVGAVAMLLQYDAPVNWIGRKDVITVLLQYQVDIYHRALNGRSPMDMAILSGDLALVEQLKDYHTRQTAPAAELYPPGHQFLPSVWSKRQRADTADNPHAGSSLRGPSATDAASSSSSSSSSAPVAAQVPIGSYPGTLFSHNAHVPEAKPESGPPSSPDEWVWGYK